MSVAVARVDFSSAGNSRDPDKFNMDGLPRISDEQHLLFALRSDNPFSYIDVRKGRMVYDGEDGIGGLNADAMFRALATKDLKRWMPWTANNSEIVAHLNEYTPCDAVISKVAQMDSPLPDFLR